MFLVYTHPFFYGSVLIKEQAQLDAIFKDYQEYIFQNIFLRKHNIKN